MKRILSIFLLVLLSLAVRAQETQYEAMLFSRTDRNPVTLGMGTAGYASLDQMAWASYRNAAALSLSEKTGAMSFSWSGMSPAAPDGMSHHFNVGTGLRFGKLGVALGASYMPGHAYDVLYESGVSGGVFKPLDFQANLGVSFAILKNLSIGVNGRVLLQNLAPERSYTAFAGDVSVMYRLSGLTVAAGLSNIGTQVTSSTGIAYPLPTSVTAGLCYRLDFAQKHSVTAALDADYFLTGRFTAAAGVQYTALNLISVRAGYHLGTPGSVLPSFVTLGAGVHFAGLRLDVAYITANELLGNSLSASLAYTF